MKTDKLDKAKDLISAYMRSAKEIDKLVNPREFALIKELVYLESLPSEELQEYQQLRLDDIKNALAENPPWKRVSYPTGVEPLPTPKTAIDRAKLMEPHYKAATEALEALVENFGFQPGVQFQVVPMKSPPPVRVVKRPNVFVRAWRWVRGLFTKAK